MSTHVTAIGARLRSALHAGDTEALGALLHPDVHFQPLGAGAPATRGAGQALAWYRERRERGFRTQVDELFAYPACVVIGLRVTRPDPAPAPAPDPEQEPEQDGSALLYRLFRIQGGHIVRIRDFADRKGALAVAGSPPAAHPPLG